MTTTKNFRRDPDDPDEVAEALAEYQQAISTGYAAYRIAKRGWSYSPFLVEFIRRLYSDGWAYPFDYITW